jgi:hypothetical protein
MNPNCCSRWRIVHGSALRRSERVIPAVLTLSLAVGSHVAWANQTEIYDSYLGKVEDSTVNMTVIVGTSSNEFSPPYAGRGFVLQSDEDWLVVATALHVIFPTEQSVRQTFLVPAEVTSYQLTISSARLTESREPSESTSLSLDQVRTASLYDQSHTTSVGSILVTKGDPGAADVALLVINKRENPSVLWSRPSDSRPIPILCPREGPLDGASPKHVVAYSGDSDEIRTDWPRTRRGTRYEMSAGGVCSGDSGGAVLRAIPQRGKCMADLRLFGVVQYAPPSNAQSLPNACPVSSFEIGRVDRLLDLVGESIPLAKYGPRLEMGLFSYPKFLQVLQRVRDEPFIHDDELTEAFGRLEGDCGCLETANYYSGVISELKKQRQRMVQVLGRSPFRSALVVAPEVAAARVGAAFRDGQSIASTRIIRQDDNAPGQYEALRVAIESNERAAIESAISESKERIVEAERLYLDRSLLDAIGEQRYIDAGEVLRASDLSDADKINALRNAVGSQISDRTATAEIEGRIRREAGLY